jgi:hypothetical protein
MAVYESDVGYVAFCRWAAVEMLGKDVGGIIAALL